MSPAMDALPPRRRWALLWANTFQPEVLDTPVEACRSGGSGMPFPVQPRLGSDGRWHPAVPDVEDPRCLHLRARSRHRASISYWSDGITYRMQPPPGVDRDLGAWTSRELGWAVQLDGPTWGGLVMDVPVVARCPGWVDFWPRPSDGTAIGRVRAQLMEAFSEACSICGSYLGQFVDHDHRTGLVRGWLCRDCNTRVERCRHPAGECRFADYLTEPPGAALRLTHPQHRDRLQTRATRARLSRLLELATVRQDSDVIALAMELTAWLDARPVNR